MFEHHEIIPESLADARYHHVHHADILRCMERARLAFLEKIGHPSDALIAQNIYPVVASVNISYLREVRPGPHTITCEQGKLQNKSLFITQRMFNARRKLVAQAVVECVMMDGETRRALTPSDELVRLFTGEEKDRGI